MKFREKVLFQQELIFPPLNQRFRRGLLGGELKNTESDAKKE